MTASNPMTPPDLSALVAEHVAGTLAAKGIKP